MINASQASSTALNPSPRTQKNHPLTPTQALAIFATSANLSSPTIIKKLDQKSAIRKLAASANGTISATAPPYFGKSVGTAYFAIMLPGIATKQHASNMPKETAALIFQARSTPWAAYLRAIKGKTDAFTTA